MVLEENHGCGSPIAYAEVTGTGTRRLRRSSAACCSCTSQRLKGVTSRETSTGKLVQTNAYNSAT